MVGGGRELGNEVARMPSDVESNLNCFFANPFDSSLTFPSSMTYGIAPADKTPFPAIVPPLASLNRFLNSASDLAESACPFPTGVVQFEVL